eukprot:12417983-Karenia_brevis.AAC.1
MPPFCLQRPTGVISVQTASQTIGPPRRSPPCHRASSSPKFVVRPCVSRTCHEQYPRLNLEILSDKRPPGSLWDTPNPRARPLAQHGECKLRRR